MQPAWPYPALGLSEARQAVLSKEFGQLVSTEPPFLGIVRFRTRDTCAEPRFEPSPCAACVRGTAQSGARILLDARAIGGVWRHGQRLRDLP